MKMKTGKWLAYIPALALCATCWAQGQPGKDMTVHKPDKVPTGEGKCEPAGKEQKENSKSSFVGQDDSELLIGGVTRLGIWGAEWIDSCEAFAEPHGLAERPIVDEASRLVERGLPAATSAAQAGETPRLLY